MSIFTFSYGWPFFFLNKHDFIVSWIDTVQSGHFWTCLSDRNISKWPTLKRVHEIEQWMTLSLQKASTAGGSLEKLRASAYITSPCYPKYEPVCYYIRLSVCPSASDSDCLHARRPTSCLVCLRAFLPACLFWFASLHLVTKFICAIPKHPAPSLAHLGWLYLSDTQQPLRASVRFKGREQKKKNRSSPALPLLETKEKPKRVSALFLWTYRLQSHMKEIIKKIISHIIVSSLPCWNVQR